MLWAASMEQGYNSPFWMTYRQAKELSEAQRDKDEVVRQLRDVEKQIELLLERIIDAEHASVIKAYESKIAKLEREKLLLAEKVDRIVPPKGRLEEFF